MTPADYLKRAEECERIAKLLISEDAKDKVVQIAERWRELAGKQPGSDVSPRPA